MAISARGKPAAPALINVSAKLTRSPGSSSTEIHAFRNTRVLLALASRPPRMALQAVQPLRTHIEPANCQCQRGRDARAVCRKRITTGSTDAAPADAAAGGTSVEGRALVCWALMAQPTLALPRASPRSLARGRSRPAVAVPASPSIGAHASAHPRLELRRGCPILTRHRPRRRC